MKVLIKIAISVVFILMGFVFYSVTPVDLPISRYLVAFILGEISTFAYLVVCAYLENKK